MRGIRRQGNMLAIVVSIMFVLVVLVMGLHINQSRAVRGVTQAEAELQFRQSFEYAVAALLATSEPVPGRLKVSADADELNESSQASDYSKTLFSTGLPNLDPLDQDHAPGFATYRIDPDTNDAALSVFANKYQWLVTQSDTGYAAYAPEGDITLESAEGWSNPTLDDERKSAEAYSGVPVLIAAKGNIEIDELTYGSAYSSEGDLTLDGPGAIGFKGRLPLRAYQTKLQSELDTLKSTMSTATNSGNKTSQIEGDYLQTAGSMISMMFGGNDSPSLNLEQAMKVPFPSIPGGSATVPGTFYEFWIHVPHPPDFADFDDPSQRDSKADADKAKKLKDEIDKLKDEIADLKRKKQNETDQSEKDKIQDKINKKQDELRDKEQEAKDLEDEIKADSKRRNDKVEGMLGGAPDEPVTRLDDKDIPKTGIKGWAYGAVFEGFGGFLLDLITGNFEGLAGRIVNEVRVVHFGKKDYEPDFRFDDGFYAKATLNVPPGRSLRYDGNLEIEGDLWLQKGSAMHVGGDLTLSDPNAGSRNPFKASGKLVMEEGATLVVDGDVTLEGSGLYGSLWVCSAAGKLHPISTAILADGTVTIPNGSYTATSLEDAAAWLATKESSFDFLPDVLQTIFQDVAPNMGKIAGPFHTRKPFFASYAATFQLTMVPTPVGTIPIPSCIPLPRKNVLVPVFRGFTYLYTPTMNAALGENFITHTDWWGFGEGTVPVLVKVDPIRMVDGLKSVNLGGLNLTYDWDATLEKLKTDVLDKALDFVIETVVKKTVKQIATSFLPGGGFIGPIIDEAMDLVTGESDALEELQEAVVDATLGPVINEFERWVDNLRDQVEDGLAEGYLREVNGPLIYANTISVGEGSNSRLFAGMLVAKTDITIESRHFVGSLVCLNGNITAQKVLFTPHFTKASLYKPKATDSNWITRAVDYNYGKNSDSNQATGISSGVNIVRTEGWSE